MAAPPPPAAPPRSASAMHDRGSSSSHSQSAMQSQSQVPMHSSQTHSRRAPSSSSIASSGTAYSSARGSYAGSASGGGLGLGSSGSGASSSAHLESTVTKLLVSTKQLLEGLTDWSQGKISEEQVSDIYVRLGNCFNSAVAAFTKEGISMRDLKEVPQMLRIRLEAAINEEASATTLNEHLPRIRPIILDLLRGLREKQDQHQAMLAAQARAQADGERSMSVSAADSGYYPSSSHPPRQASLSGNPSGAGSSRTRQVSSGSGSGISIQQHGNRSREELVASTSSNSSGYGQQSNGRASPAPSFGAPTMHPISRPSSRNANNSDMSMHDSSNASASDFPPSGRRTPHDVPGVGGRRPSNTPRPSSLVKSRSSSSLRPSGSRSSGHHAESSTPPEAPLPPLPGTSGASMSSFQSSSSASSSSRPLPVPGAHLLSLPDSGTIATPPVPRMGPLPPDTGLSTTPPSLQQSLPGPSAFATPPRSTLRPMPPMPQASNNTLAVNGQGTDDASLEALKKADPLARRASKRFSAYTFSKISSSNLAGNAGSPGGLGLSVSASSLGMERDDSAREFMNATGGSGSGSGSAEKPGSAPRKPKKARSPRSEIPEPPVPALPPLNGLLPKLSFSPDDTPSYANSHANAQTPKKKRVSVVAEETEDQLEADHDEVAQERVSSTGSGSTLTPRSAEKRPAPTLPRSESSTSIASTASQYSAIPESSSQPLPQEPPTPTSPPAPPKPKTIYLQLGRDMKKATLDPATPPTFTSLRMLFTDRFAYNPGLADFPAIYLRDTTSGVQYELEDIDEIREHSVLSLNIEPLDQVKQHIDEGLAALARELKELKTTMNSTKRASIALVAAQNIALPPQTPLMSPPTRNPPTEFQLHSAAQQVLQMKRKLSSSVAVPTSTEASVADQLQNLVSPTPSTASASEARVMRLASDLKSSFEEIRGVRRDVGTLRQVYMDFRAETANIIGSLRSQTEHVKDLANTKVAGSRSFIDTGKAKLDTRSQDLLTKIEDLQDTIDDLKNDVTTRRMRPKPKQTDAVKASIASTQAELDDLTKYIATVKPMWKKTWEAELQNIVDEQHLLNYQEELLSDLKTDHEHVVNLFSQIQEYVSMQQTTKGRKPSYRPPSPEAGHEGLSTVMLEIKGKPQASDKRMKAIEMAEKARQKEAADKNDEFADELNGFVEGKLLKKTGGAEEAERIRQLKSEASLKAMFNQGSSMPPAAPTSNAGLGLKKPAQPVGDKSTEGAASPAPATSAEVSAASPAAAQTSDNSPAQTQ